MSTVGVNVEMLRSFGGYFGSVLNWKRGTVLVETWGKSDGSVPSGLLRLIPLLLLLRRRPLLLRLVPLLLRRRLRLVSSGQSRQMCGFGCSYFGSVSWNSWRGWCTPMLSKGEAHEGRKD